MKQLESQQDSNRNVGDLSQNATAWNTLAFFAANGIPTGLPAPAPAFVPGSAAYFAPVAAALIPDGPNGVLCTSQSDDSGRGVFGGNGICSDQSLQFDRSNQYNTRSEEHTSELQSLMRISYAVFCLKKKN